MNKYKKKENGKNQTGRQEKYTLEFVSNELNEMLKYIDSDEGSDVVFIGELCLWRGYSSQRWSEITKKFSDNDYISETIKNIEQKLEYRLFKAGLSNEANATMVIFGLKNKYIWKDKHELSTDVTIHIPERIE